MWGNRGKQIDDMETRLEALQEALQQLTTTVESLGDGLELPPKLEARLERLELDHSQRQIAVMSSLEKVLNQLRARERKREQAEQDPEDRDSDGGVANGGRSVAHYAPPALQMKKFRRY